MIKNQNIFKKNTYNYKNSNRVLRMKKEKKIGFFKSQMCLSKRSIQNIQFSVFCKVVIFFLFLFKKKIFFTGYYTIIIFVFQLI